MDSESESINLVVSEHTSRSRDARPESKSCKHQSTHDTSARDFDSLNNLIYLDGDTESILSDLNNGVSLSTDAGASMTEDTCSILTNHSAMRKHNYSRFPPDDNMNIINSKLRFKTEFEKHRTVVHDAIKEGAIENERTYKLNSKKSIWRSFIALCIGLLFAFISFMPLRNIQTSLYPRHHLGNVSLACMYFCFAIGCLFSSWITQNCRPKGVILMAMFGHVVYCVTNMYPSFYTLVPGACFFGFYHAPLWTTQELMIASYAASYTTVAHINIDKAIQQFQSVFLVFCHAAQVLGNLMASAILQCGEKENRPINISLYQADLEEDMYDKEVKITNITDERDMDNYKRLVWMGPFSYNLNSNVNFTNHDKPNYEDIIKYVFVAFSVMGMTIICLFLNKPDIIVHKKKSGLCERMRDVLWFIPTGTFFSLVLLMLFSGMQQAVVIGNVTKMYGSLAVGVSMVGYMMMCYGTCQLVVLLLVEKAHNHLRTSVVIFNAFLISLGLLVWLYIWEPTEENVIKILGYVGLWGAVDGLWQSQVQNVLLAWSTGRKEAAVTIFRTVQSLGLVLVFVLDIYVTLLNLICICGGILVIGVILYLILEVVRSPTFSTEPSPFAL